MRQELIIKIVVALIESGKFDRVADQRTNIKRAVELANEILEEADKVCCKSKLSDGPSHAHPTPSFLSPLRLLPPPH